MLPQKIRSISDRERRTLTCNVNFHDFEINLLPYTPWHVFKFLGLLHTNHYHIIDGPNAHHYTVFAHVESFCNSKRIKHEIFRSSDRPEYPRLRYFTMNDPRDKAEQGLMLLEEAILNVLGAIHPDALRATEIRDALAIQDPQRGYSNYLTDSLIKRLEERGLVEQVRKRGPWRLIVK